ncbi:MAG: AMP-binding protein [Oscillospiraceae bacterium]
MVKLIQSIHSTAITSPQRTAYITTNESITYGCLWGKVSMLGNALKAQGIRPIIIYGHKSTGMIISLLACLYSKRTYICVETNTPAERLKKIIRLSGAELIIKNEPLDFNGLPGFSIDENINKYKGSKPLDICNETAYIIFTSGSTGEPKGVPISYKNLDNFCRWINAIPCLKNKRKHIFNQASLCFDLSVAAIWYAFSNGECLHSVNKEEQIDLTKLLNTVREVDMMVITPTFAKLLLSDKQFSAENFPDLTCFYLCGEQLEPTAAKKLLLRFPGADVINAYGPTEATSAVSASIITMDMTELDRLPIGEISNAACDIETDGGEIILKGDSVFNGYLGNITGGYYNENGVNCYRTGDLGFIENGRLFCLGRKDNQIKYSGYRIELEDIESNIMRLKGIKQAACIAKRKPNGTVKFIKAFIVAENLTDDKIKSGISKLLPSYMIPKVITVVDALPLNNNGKIDRKVLETL